MTVTESFGWRAIESTGLFSPRYYMYYSCSEIWAGLAISPRCHRTPLQLPAPATHVNSPYLRRHTIYYLTSYPNLPISKGISLFLSIYLITTFPILS